MTLLSRLVPFYLGIFLGYLVFRDPDNAWVYGIFGGAFMAIMILEDVRKEDEPRDQD